MSLDMKYSAIKLFGKTIPLPLHHKREGVPSSRSTNECWVAGSEAASAQTASENSHDDVAAATTSLQGKKENIMPEKKEQEEPQGITESSEQQEDGASNQTSDSSKDPITTSSEVSENPKTASIDKETSSSKSSKIGDQETSTSQEKTIKKPDKILPCPRCNSMDTKFCYYNNYNVNQPRHFCKNCQRYWTAGGTMRNVPVGAGRRKNKSSSASHLRHIMAHALNGLHNSNNGTVLTFGSNSPLCETVASVLNLSDKSQNGSVRNGYHRPEQRTLLSGDDNADDHSSGSSVTASNSSEKGKNGGSQEGLVKNCQGLFPAQVPCFPGPTPWPCPWNSAMPPPTLCSSGFSTSFYPAPTYWSCAVPSPWNVAPCISPPSPSLKNATSFSPTSPLGKHSRDGNILNRANSEKPSSRENNNSSERNVLVPKTLRIDDPSEAAKSSIWATLAIKSQKSSPINGGGLFKGFQSKNEDRNCIEKTSSLLQANPAALSRSLNFHERN